MNTMRASNVYPLIVAVAPIDGVGIGQIDDKSTWRIDFKEEATEEQRAAAQAIIDSYDINAITSEDVNMERDHRINNGFVYDGNEFQTDASSRENIIGAQGLSLGAIIADPQGAAGLRWADPDVDFSWTDAVNNEILMTASECQAFCQAAMQYKTEIIKSARVIKDTSPTPGDYADDKYWPSRTLD